MDHEAVYRQVALGQADPTDVAWSRRTLQQLALHHAVTGDPDARLEALRVANALGAGAGAPVAYELACDPDPRVRIAAFNQAVEAGEGGVAAIRRAAGGADPELACAALDLLVRWVDRQGGAVARRCLGSPHAGVRARAVRLLGLSAGPGALAELGRLRDDVDEAVRAAVVEAEARIRGDAPKPPSDPWWVGAAPEPLAGPAPSPEAPPDAPALPVPVSSVDAASAGAAPPAGPALPAELPTETRALARLLGMVAPNDRPIVARALADRRGELSDLFLGHRVGGDRALGRGLAYAAAALAMTGAASRLVAWLADPDPGVREAAAEAIGTLGGPTHLPTLAARIADPEPTVGAAAVRALVALAVRVGRPDVARDQLGRVGKPTNDPLRTALDEAKRLLGG